VPIGRGALCGAGLRNDFFYPQLAKRLRTLEYKIITFLHYINPVFYSALQTNVSYVIINITPLSLKKVTIVKIILISVITDLKLPENTEIKFPLFV